MSATEKPARIAVDIGGTFTDLQIFVARTGGAVAFKVPTTPDGIRAAYCGVSDVYASGPAMS